MDRRVILVVVIVAIAAVAGGLYVMLGGAGRGPPEVVEHLGGRYNATVSLWEGYGELDYTDEDGVHAHTYFMVEMTDGLNWIKANTLASATFLCWWDYGHMIKGYAERNVIARNPSEETVDCVADPSSITEFDPHERVADVAAAFTTSDSTAMLQIMEKYEATYIVVCTDDLSKAPWMFRIAGLTETEYMDFQDASVEFTAAGRETMIAKLLENRDLECTLVYEDEEIKIYETP